MYYSHRLLLSILFLPPIPLHCPLVILQRQPQGRTVLLVSTSSTQSQLWNCWRLLGSRKLLMKHTTRLSIGVKLLAKRQLPARTLQDSLSTVSLSLTWWRPSDCSREVWTKLDQVMNSLSICPYHCRWCVSSRYWHCYEIGSWISYGAIWTDWLCRIGHCKVHRWRLACQVPRKPTIQPVPDRRSSGQRREAGHENWRGILQIPKEIKKMNVFIFIEMDTGAGARCK